MLLSYLFAEPMVDVNAFQLVIMVGIRKMMEFVFPVAELRALDDQMPEFHLCKKEDAKKKKDQEVLYSFIY